MNLLGPRPSREAHVAEREFEAGASNPAPATKRKPPLPGGFLFVSGGVQDLGGGIPVGCQRLLPPLPLVGDGACRPPEQHSRAVVGVDVDEDDIAGIVVHGHRVVAGPTCVVAALHCGELFGGEVDPL